MTTLTPPSSGSTWTLPDGRVMSLINGKWKYVPGGPNEPGSLVYPIEFDTPVPLNEWKNGKQVWCYRCNFGALPKTATKTVPHPQVVMDMLPSDLILTGVRYYSDQGINDYEYDINCNPGPSYQMSASVNGACVRYNANFDLSMWLTRDMFVRFLRNDI